MRSERKIMRSRAKQAWLLKCGSLLVCSSARAFSGRGGTGADGLTPSTGDVVWEARFSTPLCEVRVNVHACVQAVTVFVLSVS